MLLSWCVKGMKSLGMSTVGPGECGDDSFGGKADVSCIKSRHETQRANRPA